MCERVQNIGPVWLLLMTVACGGGDSADSESAHSISLQGNTYCEKASFLARTLGCPAPIDCPDGSIPPECEPLFMAWIDCIARDISQCICESSGELNCEGSFKPNEGPALCINEATAAGQCQVQLGQDSGDATVLPPSPGLPSAASMLVNPWR